MAIPLSINCLSAKPDEEENSSIEHRKYKNFESNVDAFGRKNENMAFGGANAGTKKKVCRSFPAAAGFETSRTEIGTERLLRKHSS